MDWKDIAGVVGRVAGSVAPLLAGGPVGLAVSIGSQIAGALGTEATPEAVKAELESNPEAVKKLQEWAHIEREQIRQYNIRLGELALAAQEIELKSEGQRLEALNKTQETHKDSEVPGWLTLGLFVLVASALAGLFFVAIPESNRDMINYSIGQLFGFFGASVTFWLGPMIKEGIGKMTLPKFQRKK